MCEVQFDGSGGGGTGGGVGGGVGGAGVGLGGVGGGVGLPGQQSTALPAHLCGANGYGPQVPGQPTLGSLHGPCEPSGQLAQPEEPSAAQR